MVVLYVRNPFVLHGRRLDIFEANFSLLLRELRSQKPAVCPLLGDSIPLPPHLWSSPSCCFLRTLATSLTASLSVHLSLPSSLLPAGFSSPCVVSLHDEVKSGVRNVERSRNERTELFLERIPVHVLLNVDGEVCSPTVDRSAIQHKKRRNSCRFGCGVTAKDALPGR